MALALVHSGDTLTIDGEAYPGVPIFVDTDSMRICYEPTEWMLYLAVVNARTRSPKTWKKVSLAILQWLRFAEEKGWGWRSFTERNVAHFRNQLERGQRPGAPIARTWRRKTPYAKNSIRRKIAIICSFYEWGIARGLLDGNLQNDYDPRSSSRGLLAHIASRAAPRPVLSARDILVPKTQPAQKLPRYFTAHEIETILSRLGRRDQLITLWALHTGAREFEICAFTMTTLPAAERYRSKKFYALWITETKNCKPGNIFVPTWLLDETFKYAKYFERRAIVSDFASRNKKTTNGLWLTRLGRGIKPDTIYRSFKAAALASGIDGTFHDLRHTYAINSLEMLMRRSKNSSEESARDLLRIMMRHEDEKTTSMYLRARKLYRDVIWGSDIPSSELIMAS